MPHILAVLLLWRSLLLICTASEGFKRHTLRAWVRVRMMNTSRSGSPVKENKGQGLWPRVVKEDGFHVKAISQEERNLCWLKWKGGSISGKRLTVVTSLRKKILPDTKKGCMTVRQVSIGNSLAIWDSTWLGLYTHRSLNNASTNLEPPTLDNEISSSFP